MDPTGPRSFGDTPLPTNRPHYTIIPGSMTPIKLNPDFPPGMHPLFLTDQWPSDHVRAHQFFHQGKLLSATQIANNLKKAPIPPWTYLLIAHYLKTLNKAPLCSEQLSPFETICTKTTPQTHLISYIHNLLFADLKANDNLACKNGKKTFPSHSQKRTGRIYLRPYTKGR